MKKIRSIILILVIGIGISIGLNYVYASWSDPASAPPGTYGAPIVTSAVQQVKEAFLSVNTFSAGANSLFEQLTQIKGALKDDTNSTATLDIGGIDLSSEKYVDTTIEGRLETTGTLGSSDIKSSKKLRLCGDDTGHVIFCPQDPPYDNIDLTVAYGSIQLSVNYIPLNNFENAACVSFDAGRTAGNPIPNTIPTTFHFEGSSDSNGGGVGCQTNTIGAVSVPAGTYTIQNVTTQCPIGRTPQLIPGSGSNFVVAQNSNYVINYTCL